MNTVTVMGASCTARRAWQIDRLPCFEADRTVIGLPWGVRLRRARRYFERGRRAQSPVQQIEHHLPRSCVEGLLSRLAQRASVDRTTQDGIAPPAEIVARGFRLSFAEHPAQ